MSTIFDLLYREALHYDKVNHRFYKGVSVVIHRPGYPSCHLEDTRDKSCFERVICSGTPCTALWAKTRALLF